MTIIENRGGCPRCDEDTPRDRPTCIRCGLTQPWARQALRETRRARFRDFIEKERAEELAWLNDIEGPEGRARTGFGYEFDRALHMLRLQPVRAIGVVAVAASLLLTGMVIGRATSKKYTPRPETVATARCVDGSWSYAANRAGACSGHGGVEVFYQ